MQLSRAPFHILWKVGRTAEEGENLGHEPPACNAGACEPPSLGDGSQAP